jgi:hypothetical protein
VFQPIYRTGSGSGLVTGWAGVGAFSGGGRVTGSRVGDTGSSRGMTVYLLTGSPICPTAELRCRMPIKSVPPLTDIRQLGRCRSSQLTSAAVVVPHANHGGRVTASVASQWNVSEERIAIRTLATDQEWPGHVSHPAAFRAGRSQMRVALALRLGDGPASPKRINFHKPMIAHRCTGASSAVVEKQKPRCHQRNHQ